ncbi:PTS system mannose/fructose/sorbose family transporter subunit IID [Escherichia coli]|uniref:PTS system mannose/fructose/sorbose family transporter subunit IID n=1 Tax=Escherichia coli TaxID=562 RepID=A0A376TUA8_ECOLX|nr:PTS system mannose/fructose/sorbose family transporter subunit IID [Escherichia coli]
MNWLRRARESGTLTKADITKAWFIYWLGAEVSSSYERLQSLIFCASMTPIIKKLYPQKEEQVEALKRHLNFFNSEQTFGRGDPGDLHRHGRGKRPAAR